MRVLHLKSALDNFDVASEETGLRCEDESRAKQQFKEECDINTIVRRFGLTGELPSNIRMPTNGDFTDIPDFKTAMNMIVAARESFDAMPSEVRKRFHNDPAEFVEFCSDDKNRAEALKLGLVPPPAPAPEAPEPVAVRVVEPVKAP